ncbi:SurA N-terminal domain-containing protein [Candidatus Dependentiae bacterium]|nr:SurA N-terminal domain-containing protein [Candidatus Dependentiae bacterium]
MIFLFRKEIQKWNKIWWFVIASLALGSVSFFFMGGPGKEDIKIATVNDETISLKTFHQTYAETKASLDDLAMYWGIPVDRLVKMMGMENMPQQALSQCVQGVLLDNLTQSFAMHIDSKSFQEALSGAISKSFVDRFGKINIPAYQNYLSRLQMSISDYENRKEKEFYRNALVKFVTQSAYVPEYSINELTEQDNMRKSFSVMILPMSGFLGKVRAEAASTEDLQKFFKEKQELYRVNEKRRVKYIELTPEEYKQKVEVDDEIIEKFYEKNKSALYRVPPKVKVQTIVFPFDESASPDLIESVRKKAEETLEKVKQEPKGFKGKLMDFFQRGTHDPEFEKVAFLELKKPGDISDLIKTKKGFEIIKLEDRIAASEKPLADVRKDVIETIMNRKAMFVLRGDLEAVMRTSKTEKEIFEKFTSSNKIKVNETDWLTKDDAKGYELLDTIAQKMFSERTGDLSYGYFVHRGKHILYKEVEKKNSFIPSYEKVAGMVEDDWYEEKARDLQKKTVKELRKELFSKNDPIESVAGEHGFKVVKTALLKQGDEVDALREAGDLLSEAFGLTDQSQVLAHQHKSDSFLVKLSGQENVGQEKEVAAAKRETVFEAQESAAKQRYLAGFIASLQRNATIDVREDILKLS